MANHLNHLSSRQTSRDEILKAKLPGGGGRVKEERKRERLSERPVVSLTRPTTPYNQRGFHRVDPATSRMPRNFTISDWKISNWPITDWRIHHLARVCGFSGFGLRSASGESGAEGREKRLAHRSRSATSRRRAADGSLPLLRQSANARS